MEPNQRYEVKPHTFTLTRFMELPPILIGLDGMCDCVVGETKLHHLCKSNKRCSIEELKQHDREASYRRGYQS